MRGPESVARAMVRVSRDVGRWVFRRLRRVGNRKKHWFPSWKDMSASSACMILPMMCCKQNNSKYKRVLFKWEITVKINIRKSYVKN